MLGEQRSRLEPLHAQPRQHDAHVAPRRRQLRQPWVQPAACGAERSQALQPRRQRPQRACQLVDGPLLRRAEAAVGQGQQPQPPDHGQRGAALRVALQQLKGPRHVLEVDVGRGVPSLAQRAQQLAQQRRVEPAHAERGGDRRRQAQLRVGVAKAELLHESLGRLAAGRLVLLQLVQQRLARQHELAVGGEHAAAAPQRRGGRTRQRREELDHLPGHRQCLEEEAHQVRRTGRIARLEQRGGACDELVGRLAQQRGHAVANELVPWGRGVDRLARRGHHPVGL